MSETDDVVSDSDGCATVLVEPKCSSVHFHFGTPGNYYSCDSQGDQTAQMSAATGNAEQDLLVQPEHFILIHTMSCLTTDWNKSMLTYAVPITGVFSSTLQYLKA